MDLVPSQSDVLKLLRETGGLRHGHFIYSNGLHANEYLQVALSMRYSQHARVLSVGLSRLLRSNPELRAMIPQLSVVAPATGGLPVAYGVCEALRAHQVYWAENEIAGGPLRFRQFLDVDKGEKVLLVDDILRSGRRLTELKQLVESKGAEVVALAVMIYQPNPDCIDFSPLPLYYLAKLEATYYRGSDSCEMCRNNEPAVQVLV